MKKIYLLFALLFATQSIIEAQITVAGKYEINSADAWKIPNTDESIVKNSISINLGFWTKPLKEYRWNFIPEIGYGTGSHTTLTQDIYNWSRFDLTLNNHLYLFGMESDCNCPTFSKQGSFLSKGLFFNLAPGISYGGISHEYTDMGATSNHDANPSISFKYSIGLGFDFGLNDLITITPFANYTKRISAKWDPAVYNAGFEAAPGPISGSVSQIEAGIRLNLRFDYAAQNNGFRR